MLTHSNVVSLNNITVRKYGNTLFDQFSFSITQNEHYVIQGENGSGKTTLLEVIAGITHPVNGEVNYAFINENQDWEIQYQTRKNKIHYIPAHALKYFTGYQPEFFYQQRYYTMGDIDLPRVRDFFGNDLHKLNSLNIPESFNIDHLLDLELTRLSNGQLKKVLILKNMTKEIPAILLFDYPFEGLDRGSRQALSDFIDFLVKAFNIQIVITDHYHVLPKAINRRLVLDQFKILGTAKISHTKQAENHINQYSAQRMPNVENAIVNMENITIQYGKKKIIENFNWVINKGERWALTGRNGSGKTTLFSMIFADHPMAYSQKIFLFGKRRGTGESIWDIKKRIAYLGPEHIHFLQPESVFSSGREYLRNASRDQEHKLQHLIGFFSAGDFIDRPVKHYSSGELQLLLLFHFFLNEKELLLLDEPFQFLDMHRKEKVSRYLEASLLPDTTMILITHYEADVQKWTKFRMRL